VIEPNRCLIYFKKQKGDEKMKKIVLAIAMLVFMFCQTVFAEVKIQTDVSILSQYIGGVSGATVYRKPVIQENVAVTKNDFFFNVWHSSSFESYNQDFSTELDLTFAKLFRWGDWSGSLAYSFYDLYRVGEIKGDLHVICFALDFPKAFGFRPYVYSELDIPTDRDILPGGFLYRFGFTKQSELMNINFSLAGHSGAFGKAQEILSSARLILSKHFKVTKQFSVIPLLEFQKTFHDDGITQDRIWGGIDFRYDF
jgi:hypothetical protein